MLIAFGSINIAFAACQHRIVESRHPTTADAFVRIAAYDSNTVKVKWVGEQGISSSGYEPPLSFRLALLTATREKREKRAETTTTTTTTWRATSGRHAKNGYIFFMDFLLFETLSTPNYASVDTPCQHTHISPETMRSSRVGQMRVTHFYIYFYLRANLITFSSLAVCVCGWEGVLSLVHLLDTGIGCNAMKRTHNTLEHSLQSEM